MANVIYEGFFLKDGVVLPHKLERDIPFKHVTTEFHPAQPHPELYGQKATFIVKGYGLDEDNEGIALALESCDSDELRVLYEQIGVPHMTLSVSANGKPVNTAKLDFFYGRNSMKIETVFGGFIAGQRVTA